jgi:preprotein translocase subunit Sec61beta
MEWFSQKTSIAGIEIPNWVIVVGAAIVIMLILARL